MFCHECKSNELNLGCNHCRDRKAVELCKENENWFFIWTDENDMYNLKDKLGKKLNSTPLNRLMWK